MRLHDFLLILLFGSFHFMVEAAYMRPTAKYAHFKLHQIVKNGRLDMPQKWGDSERESERDTDKMCARQ